MVETDRLFTNKSVRTPRAKAAEILAKNGTINSIFKNRQKNVY